VTITKYKVEAVGKTGGKMIYGSPSDAKTLLSIITTDGPSFTVIDMIFEALTQGDPDNGQPMSWLAKSWEISADGLTYTFTLQDGVNWQDGQPLTANDVKFTYDLILNPDTKSSFTSDLQSKLKSMNVIDDTHIAFNLKAPNAAFLALSTTTGYEIIPQHILKDVPAAKLASDTFTTGAKGRTIGTGPFLFQEWVKDDHVLVVKNPNYWGGAPALDQWFYKVVPSSSVLTQQLRTGDVDFGAIQPADYASMTKQSNITVSTYDTYGFEFYGYNLDPAKTTLFQEQEVRQALLIALDREQMLKALNFGLGTVADTTIPVLSWAYDPSAIKVDYSYNPSKAESMLDAAGWKKGSDGIRAKNGKKLSFNINTSPITQVFVEYAQAMQQEWAKIGVQATPKSEEWNAYLNRITGTHDFDVFIVGFGWFADPDESLMWKCDAYQGGFNLYKYCNPQVDKLLAQGLLTTDHAKRIAIYNEMENIIETDLPAATLYLAKAIAGVNKRVHNYFPNAVNTTWDLTKWWVD